jgi:hypothetical protein
MALPAAVMADRQLAGHEAVMEASREHHVEVLRPIWGTARRDAHRRGFTTATRAGEGKPLAVGRRKGRRWS